MNMEHTKKTAYKPQSSKPQPPKPQLSKPQPPKPQPPKPQLSKPQPYKTHPPKAQPYPIKPQQPHIYEPQEYEDPDYCPCCDGGVSAVIKNTVVFGPVPSDENHTQIQERTESINRGHANAILNSDNVTIINDDNT